MLEKELLPWADDNLSVNWLCSCPLLDRCKEVVKVTGCSCNGVASQVSRPQPYREFTRLIRSSCLRLETPVYDYFRSGGLCY